MLFRIWNSFAKRRESTQAIVVKAQFSVFMKMIEDDQMSEHYRECIAQGFVALAKKFRELAEVQLPPHAHENYMAFISPRDLKKEAANFKKQAAANSKSNDTKRVLLGITQELFGYYLICMSWESSAHPKGDGKSILNSPGVVRANIRNRISQFLVRFDIKID